MSGNFNYFRLIYFCLGHVLGTRFSVLLHAKNFAYKKGRLIAIADTIDSNLM